MRKIRGFKIGKRVIRFSKWVIGKARRKPYGYRRLKQGGLFSKSNSLSKFINWGRRLKNAAKSICSVKLGSGYGPIEEKPIEVPKGHLAVYVGRRNGGDFHRVLVPVIYFNHPLFGELLREVEKEYGFCHQGGIIPVGSRNLRRFRPGSPPEPSEGKSLGSVTIERLPPPTLVVVNVVDN
ncbi:hypothetical protein ES332_A12G118000v1 [Gossypium tomentosum]|uniref:Auxin-responsive protein n=1 Tax=Gossypium tomentosum TaxID=34277 RepID=A0A5D2MWF2_GOSTO|nr:hypothetical protein ES332_A12G118000v1 [Gossypium tomentosum]